eukprot:TRINITY_DN18521_c0_g1_i2.p1 TRINITY_DN18521_c0_g1~~TRINITY_DN18521_c0_g1_i2.p1  ORF type:complete len:194 (+),score=43.11 TRINITY_DN18521_c0_g1_i2:271-852(+)
MFAVIPAFGGTQGQFDRLEGAPAEATGWVSLVALVGIVSVLMFSAAAQWCPAAVSATVDTATRMVVGYLMQVIFFGGSLDFLTSVGAICMLLSVAIMSLVKPNLEESAEEATQATTSASNAPSSISQDTEASAPRADDADETESLASFVASEFSEIALQESPKARLRQRISAQQEAPQIVGAAMVASVVMHSV